MSKKVKDKIFSVIKKDEEEAEQKRLIEAGKMNKRYKLLEKFQK